MCARIQKRHRPLLADASLYSYISLTYIREIDDFYKQHVPQRVIYSTSVCVYHS